MTEYLQFGLLTLGAGILIFIILDGIWKRRGKKEARLLVESQNIDTQHFQREPQNFADSRESCIHSPPTQTTSQVLDEDILMLSVIAKPGTYFGSYDLLQAISATGMQFGHMGLFHCYSSTLTGRAVLFSLASATAEGSFNMDRIGEFSCAGLILFMKIRQVPNPEEAFEKMLATAKQLADDLDGELRAGPRQAWNEAVLQEYRNKLLSSRACS